MGKKEGKAKEQSMAAIMQCEPIKKKIKLYIYIYTYTLSFTRVHIYIYISHLPNKDENPSNYVRVRRDRKRHCKEGHRTEQAEATY